jgi:hypothetical protein
MCRFRDHFENMPVALLILHLALRWGGIIGLIGPLP